MVDVRPFRALRPASGAAARLISPPYDVVDVEEARAYAAGDPDSFLRVSRPEIDLPPQVDAHAEEVYALGRRNLDELVTRGVLVRDERPTFSVYRQVMGQVRQTGIVGAVAVADYDAGRVRTHEHTRHDKELDRVRHIEALDAHDEPVFLLAARSADVDVIVDRVMRRDPSIDLVARDGVEHTLWVVDDPAEVDALRRALGEVGDFYVADGHHRSAAASRLAATREGEPGEHDAFLAVVFPLDDVHVMAYNRVVADLRGRTPDQLVAEVGAVLDLAEQSHAVTPSRQHEFGMYVDGRWFVLAAPTGTVDESDPLARLDVSILQDRVLGPLLGIGDPRTDSRIAFVGGIRGVEEIERLVDSGRAAVGFVLFPTSTADLVQVADTGQVMPPKSTWFEPKLASGLVVHPLDG
jgi:uncharacterized protein (DUF1015 family)